MLSSTTILDALGINENETAKWHLSQLGPNSVFLDLGTNYGYFSLITSHAVEPNGHVHSFAHPHANVDLIDSLVRLNSISNISVHQCALSDFSGTVDFTVEMKNANSHIAAVSLSHAPFNPLSTISVPLVTLDRFCS